jgi:hypothetical protein
VVELCVLGYATIIDPTITMADDLMSSLDEGARQLGMLFDGTGDAENTYMDAKIPENIQ